MPSRNRMSSTRCFSPEAMVEAVLVHAASTDDLAGSTLAEFADIMRCFALFSEQGLGVADVSAIGEDEVRAFIGSRRVDGRKPSLSLMHNRRTACRYLFRTARALGICPFDPSATVELPPRSRVSPRPLTDDEIRLCRSYALFHPADLRHPVAWALAEATARTHEIARVLVGDVAVAPRAVRLGGSPHCDARTVALTDWGMAQVRRRLDHARKSPEDLLVPFRSRKVPRASASMTVIEVLRRAGIKAPDVRPISVAAWRGARAYADGSSIEELAALLGMRSLDRTAALIGLKREARSP
jgi:site-specific recombinase XerD